MNRCRTGRTGVTVARRPVRPLSCTAMNDPDLHLFVDDAEIQHYVNLMRVVNKPSRPPHPVLRADRTPSGATS